MRFSPSSCTSGPTSFTLYPDAPADFPPNADRHERADALGAEITALYAHINAATARLLELIVELDRLEVFGAWRRAGNRGSDSMSPGERPDTDVRAGAWWPPPRLRRMPTPSPLR